MFQMLLFSANSVTKGFIWIIKLLFYFLKKRCPTLRFFPVSWVRLQTLSHTQIARAKTTTRRQYKDLVRARIEPVTRCIAVDHRSTTAPTVPSEEYL